MPALNLRLSEQEHEELVLRAAANGRSVQREIVWTLFRGRGGDGQAEGAGGVRPDRSQDAGSDTSAATGLGDDVPVAAPRSRQRCVREARHHINHSGRPCEVCGWPLKGEAE